MNYTEYSFSKLSEHLSMGMPIHPRTSGNNSAIPHLLTDKANCCRYSTLLCCSAAVHLSLLLSGELSIQVFGKFMYPLVIPSCLPLRKLLTDLRTSVPGRPGRTELAVRRKRSAARDIQIEYFLGMPEDDPALCSDHTIHTLYCL